ncbi:hypothetical protein ABH929_000532 [Curtobacterium sp. AB7]
MLLPDKYITPAASLLGTGLLFWDAMPGAVTIGEGWYLYRTTIDSTASFFRYVLMLDVLFTLERIDCTENILTKRTSVAN